MPIRTFLCRRCQLEFDKLVDQGEIPQCRKCGSYDHQIIPGGCHPLKSLRRRDNIMRMLADSYGLTNMKSAREGESMAPDVPTPKFENLNGVSMGDMVTCNPIQATGDLMAKAGPPIKQPKLPSLREKTVIEARWSRDKGETRP